MSKPRKLREGQTRDVLESVAVGVVLTSLSYIVGLLAGWIQEWNGLEVFAVFTSYACTYLCVKERRINYPIGIVSTAAYSYLFMQNGLFASAILNAYLVPTLIYGWFRWRRDSDTRPVTRVDLKMIPVYLGVTGLVYMGAVLISQSLGGATAWTDSVILAATILAQFLLDNKKIETWGVWAVVNIFAIYTYAASGLPLVAFQYVFFLANTMYGFYMWNRSKNHGTIIHAVDSDAADNRPLATDTV